MAKKYKWPGEKGEPRHTISWEQHQENLASQARERAAFESQQATARAQQAGKQQRLVLAVAEAARVDDVGRARCM